MRRSLLITVLSITVFAGMAADLKAEPPNYRFVPMLHDGKLFSFDGRTADLNDVGQVVFRAAFPADSAAGVPLGDSFNVVIWDNDQLYLVDHPTGSAGGGVDRAVGINDAGKTTGAYNPPNASLHLHAFVTTRFGTFAELGLLPDQHPPDTTFGPCNWAWGHDITDFDQVAGIAYEGSNFFTREAHGVIWTNGTPAKIPHPSGLTDAETGYFLPFFINNSGQVASTNSYLGTTTAFFGTADGTDTLPKNIAGVQLTEVTGLSATGLVIGKMEGNLIDPSNGQTYNQEHAFVSDNGGPLFDLNESINATWRVISSANGVNSRGDIVGSQGFGAALWYQTDSGWVYYSLRSLVTEGDSIPTSFNGALAINERGTILAYYQSGLGATPCLLEPVYPEPPVVLEVDSIPPSRESYLFQVIDGLDSTVRFEKAVGYDTVNNVLDTLGYTEVIDSLKVIDMLRIMTVDSIDSVPPGEDVPVKESRLDNGTFPAPGYGLRYPTRDELPDTVRLERRSFGLQIDMSVGFEAAIDLQSYITEMVASANRILQEATDGIFYICEANVYNDRVMYDSVRYRLDQTTDLNRSPLGFRREGQAHTINPLMRFYADNGPGTFEENLAANANWSPVLFGSDQLEYNTGAPLAASILSELLGNVPPEVRAPIHPFFTTTCPKKRVLIGMEDDERIVVTGRLFADTESRPIVIPELTTTNYYALNGHSIASTFDCYSGHQRLLKTAERIGAGLNYTSFGFPNAEALPNDGLSPFRIGGPIFKEKAFFFNSPWPASSSSRRGQSALDEFSNPLPNTIVFAENTNGGIQRLGRTNLNGRISYQLDDILSNSYNLYSYHSGYTVPPGGGTLFSKDTASSSDTGSVGSILKEVSQALVWVGRSTGTGTGKLISVKQENTEPEWENISAHLKNATEEPAQLPMQKSTTSANLWTTEVESTISSGITYVLCRSTSPRDLSYLAGVSQEERITEPFDPISPSLYINDMWNGEGFTVNFGVRSAPRSPSDSLLDSIATEPGVIVTSNPWSIGQAGLPNSFRRLTSNHYIATMTEDTSEVAVFLRYADADMALLGESYHPEYLVIASRTPEDSFWTVHETAIDTNTNTAATVAMPDRFFALFAQDLATDVGDGDIAELPDGYRLAQNYPNPFNPTTTIEFNLPVKAEVTLDVFNIMGQRVRRLLAEPRTAGSHKVVWDGRAESGEAVASGIYFYRLVADEVVQSRKMILLK